MLSTLPVELLVEIFSRLDVLTVTLHVPLVCRLFRDILHNARDSSSSLLARTISRRDFREETALLDQAPSPTIHPILELLYLREGTYDRYSRLTILDIGVSILPGQFVPLDDTPFADEFATSPGCDILSIKLRWLGAGLDKDLHRSAFPYQGPLLEPKKITVSAAVRLIRKMAVGLLVSSETSPPPIDRLVVPQGGLRLLDATVFDLTDCFDNVKYGYVEFNVLVRPPREVSPAPVSPN